MNDGHVAAEALDDFENMRSREESSRREKSSAAAWLSDVPEAMASTPSNGSSRNKIFGP